MPTKLLTLRPDNKESGQHRPHGSRAKPWDMLLGETISAVPAYECFKEMSIRTRDFKRSFGNEVLIWEGEIIAPACGPGQ